MSNEPEAKPALAQPEVYQIRIEGHLGLQWTEWFGNLVIQLDDSGYTLLTGPVVDQAALYGLLKKVRDLGMPLVSVMRVESIGRVHGRSNRKKRRKGNDHTAFIR
jgi:hypothetical protein